MSGYDKFFKEAGKASGLVTGKPAPKSKFALKSERSGTAEDRLRQEIAHRARARRSVSMKKRQKFPLFAAIVAVVATVSCTIAVFQPDIAEKVLSHVDIGAFGKANATEDKKAESKKADAAKIAEPKVSPVEKAVAAATGGDAVKTEPPPDFRTWTNDELSFFNKLNDRKKELDQRESDLTKLEEELQKQKVELDEKIKKLETMRTDISKTLKTRVAVDQEKVDKLVQFYSTMKPQQAAKVIESLNEDLAVEVIDKMKKKNAAEIMNALDAKKARRLSELLTGYQRSPSSEDDAETAKE